jgi:hypothetical protein
MNVCRLTGLLVPALLVAVAVSFVTASDLYGLLAAAATVGVLALAGRVRGTGASCALPQATSPPAERAADPVDHRAS